MPRVEIDFKADGRGTIKVDDRELDYVRAVSCSLEAGEIARVEVELIGVDVNVRLEEAEVTIERVTPQVERERAG